MAENGANTELEKNLSFGALVASLVSIPVIVMQTSSTYDVHQVGEWLGAFLWLYFLFEVVVLTVASDNRIEWVLGHWLEIAIVIGTTPVFLFASSSDGGHGSIVAVFGILRVGRVVKLVKAVKAIKTGQKVTKDEIYTSRKVDLVINLSVVFVVAGLLGMLADKSRHSLLEGLWYWLPNRGGFGQMIPFVGLILIPIIFLGLRELRRNPRNP